MGTGTKNKLYSELQSLLETPLEVHRKNILESHPPLDEVLAGRQAVVIYPAARMASAAAVLLRERGVDVRGFSDKNPDRWGQTQHNLPIVPPERISELAPGGAILVASSIYDSVMRECLAACGCKNVYSMPYLNFCLPDVFSCRESAQATESPFQSGAREAILQVFDLLADEPSQNTFVSKIRYYLTLDKRQLDGMRSSRPIYFDPKVLSLRMDETFVDGGAFTGDTLQQFLGFCSGKFTRYFAFEPDPKVFEKLKQAASAAPERIECVRAGLSDRTGELHFSITGAADSTVVSSAHTTTLSLPVVDLDSFFSTREAPTFIKLDIEGSERAALAGARRVLADARPRLAVSSYHFPNDLWEIPLLLAKLNQKSRIYLRHYTREIDDTVCYSLPR